MPTHSSLFRSSVTAVAVVALLTLFLLGYDRLLNTDSFHYTVMTEFINLHTLVFPLVLALVILGLAIAVGGIAGLFGGAMRVRDMVEAAALALSGHLQILAGVMLAASALKFVEAGTGIAKVYLVVTGMVLGLLVAVSALPWALGKLYGLAAGSRWRNVAMAVAGVGLIVAAPYLEVKILG